MLLQIPSKPSSPPCTYSKIFTWCNPWLCSACVQWSILCSPQTVSEWSSGWGHLSPGRWRPWLHPGSGSWFCAGELWPGTRAASGQHCKHRQPLLPPAPHCSQPLMLSRSLIRLPKKPWNILQAAWSVSPVAHTCRLQHANTHGDRITYCLAEPQNVPFIIVTKARAANENISAQAFRNTHSSDNTEHMQKLRTKK